MEVPYKPLQAKRIGRVRVKMRRFWLLSAVVLAFSLFLNCHYAQAVEIDLSKPDTSEVLEEVSEFTGLASDVVGLVHEEHAELFKGLDNVVFAGKVVSLITEAKDTEALTAIGMKALEVCKDKLLEQALPAAANIFLTVASVYKTSLELVRDYKWIPGYEEKIYRAYRESRDKDREENIRIAKASGKKVEDESKYEDTSEEGRDTAFNMGVMTKASGYYVVKEKMLDEMAKEKMKLKSKEELGPQALKIYNRKVDEFWINRLEMRYQKERMKARKAELIKEIWAKKAQQLEAIKAAAAKMAGPERFFLTDKDIPQGWKKERETATRTYKFTPKENRSNPNNPSWVQGFGLYKAEYTQKGDNGFFTSDGKKVCVNNISVSIHISPRMINWSSSVGSGVDDALDSIKFMLTGWDSNPEWEPNPGQKFYGKFTDEGALLGYVQGGWGTGSNVNWYGVDFVKGLWRVQLSINGSSLSSIQEDEAKYLKTFKGTQEKPDRIYDKTPVSQELARTLALTVARKIPAPEPKKTEAKKK